MKHNRIAADLFSKRQVFQKLSHCTNTVSSGIVENI